ncbi:two-component system cell cycle sensor histidine kinase/response regulator CckA [Nitrobacter vulgaris]|uniref:cell cycle histidine kinase CckA n=1 Tax=Nitrobacter vulgaris TaxID=29421 RepID=UPI002863FA7B|nr:ATP-binding protein [Nitrobacter vulgaris]MDR6304832.1 two-component system cell cycle sensor histidine kinase/response regulator CckA [Nitrobacter vulgaris]
MTPDPDIDSPQVGQEPARRSGSILLVLLVAGSIVAAAVAFMTLGSTNAQPYILALLASLAMVGLFTLFAFAAGIVRFADRTIDDPLMRPIADHAFDGIAVTDSGGHVIYANSAYLALTGATSMQDVRPVERVFIGNPDVSEAVFRLLKAAREGKRQQEEVRVAAADGTNGRWLRLRVRRLAQAKRYSRYAVWSIADITRDRERQEDVFQELRHAIEYLDHAPCGFFSVNQSGDLVYVNATLANWLDHDLAEVGSGGLKLADIVSGDGASLLTSIIAAPGEVRTEVFDIDLRMRNGKTMPARLYHKLAFGADGVPGPSRTLVISRARDERVDPQRAAEVRFMRFFDNTPMAIATVDKSGAVGRANARFAKLAQSLSPDGAVAKSILAAVKERDRGQLSAAIHAAADGQGDIPPVEVMLEGARERWGQFFVTAVEDDRDAEAAIVYMLETTERRTLESQINQSQKMESVGQLAGGIAHDFNNVLSAIMMANDFLLNAHKPTDPSFQDIMQIKQNANRAAALVRQLLAFSRRQTLQPKVLDLGDTLSDIGMLLKRLIGEKVTFPGVVHGRDLWPVKADVSQFEQVIVNLVVNARDAMPNGGKLAIRTANVAAAEVAAFGHKGMPAADYVLVEIGDTGTGIPPEIVDKIFEPFFSTKEVGKGTGLGLSTVYGIVKQTGGFIYVDSKAGEGTTFRIFLPRHHPEAEAPPASSGVIGAAKEPSPAAKPVNTDLTGQGTILLVEDEEGLRSLNARGLRSRGYSVIEASNGIEALEALDENGAVDLVVSDVVMPEMDGPTLLRKMRVRNPNLRIIFVSGYAEEAFDKSLPENEQFAFLAKPFALSALIAKVKETMTAS